MEKQGRLLITSNSEFLVGNPDNNFSNRELAKISPSAVLKGLKPRMTDERQEVPSLWDAARAFVDKSNDYGTLILTGSSTLIQRELCIPVPEE